MTYELFKPSRGRDAEPIIKLTPQGILYINSKASEKYGLDYIDYNYCLLYFDKDTTRLAIIPITDKQESSVRLLKKAGTKVISISINGLLSDNMLIKPKEKISLTTNKDIINGENAIVISLEQFKSLTEVER